jgi:vitamin B12 transporter
MTLLFRAGVLAALLAVCARPVAAQTAPSPAPTTTPEIGRVSTSDRHDEPVGRTTRPTFVVDRATIEALGARTVADALKAVPGINLSPYGAFGAQADYGIRGSRSAQTLVLVNGAPVAAASNGIVDLGTYPTTSVRRIEVVESAGSTLYGSNAIGGIINIITSAPRTGVRAMTGTYGERDVEIAAGAGRFGLAFERHLATNSYAYPALHYSADAAGNYPGGIRSNDAAQQTALRAEYDTDLRGGWAVRGAAGSDAIRSQIPGGVTFLTPTSTQPVSRSNALLEFSRIRPQSTATLTLSGARQSLVFNDPAFGGQSVTYDGRAQISLRDAISSTAGDLIAGVDLSRESALIDLGPNGPPPTVDGRLAQSAIYAQYAFAVARRSRLTFGLRGEHDAPFGSALVPSIGFAIDAGTVRIAANAGGAFRVPTLVDLFYPGFSNPSLQPERTRNYDLTVALPDVLGGLSAGIFDRRGTNLIALDQNFAPQNIQRATVRGLMLTARTRPFRGFVADVGITDLFRASDDVSGARLRRIPVTRTTLGLTHPFGNGRLAFGARGLVVGSSYDNGSTLPITGVLDAYANIDAYVRYKAAPEAIFTVRVLNAGDEHAVPIYGYPAPGRRLQFELSTH